MTMSELRWSLGIATAVFAVALVAGLAAPPEVGAGQVEGLAELIEPLAGLGPLALLAVIIVNNVLTTFVFMLLGVVVGLPSLFFVLVNGYIVGAVSGALAPEMGAAAVAASLIPHGVIEIPAALLAAGIGVRLGWQALLRLTGRPSGVRATLRAGVRTYAVWVLPALLVAAVIEVFITPLIAAPFT